jgi:histidine triad (HIT) family protein
MANVGDTCVFCAIARGKTEADIVFRDDLVLAFLDHRPLFPGHTLVVPIRHVEILGELPDELALPLMRATRAAARAMERGLGAQGSFVALNNKVSQSVPHLHFHVVPRAKGDGLKGFFWPRVGYDSAEHIAATAEKLSSAIAEEYSATDRA